jgi:hypothetical protein
VTEINIDNNIYGIESSTVAKPKQNEAQEQEVKEAVTQPAEPQKKERRGRKRKEQTDLSASFELVSKKHAVQESLVTKITFKSEDEKLLKELVTRQFLSSQNVVEPASAVVLNYIHDNALTVGGIELYLQSTAHVAENVGLAYSTTQKAIKHLVDNKVLLPSERASQGWELSKDATAFFETIRKSMQIVLTFEHLKEVQTEAINADGSINEDFQN